MMLEKFQAGCPWFDLYTKFPPNVEWCEEKLCSWIVTPNNTFTNLAYMLIGFFIWRQMKDAKSAILRFFGPIVVMVGVTSFVFHMSLNFFTQVFDYIGMYAFCVLLIMCNLARLNCWPKPPKAFVAFWLSIVGLTALTILMYFVHLPYQAVVLLLIFVIIGTELKAKASTRYYFWAAVGCLFVAVNFSGLDHERILCTPENHYFQGHGFWHVLGSISLWCSYQHYLQFKDELW